ncbi:MAG: flagellar hook-associated protein FlgK, partial [Deltaproteobacteria bacterium]|nr:flagellar hook-associated protein FlgK [Deltaproteobacteria bacterium]
MATLNAALDIAKTALLSAQKSINVTSHNIANANTEGYTRQRAVVEPSDPVLYGGLFFGTGVSVNNVVRIYDGFQVAQLRDANSTLSRYETAGSLVKGLEAALNDLGNGGILTRLDSFF